MQINMLSCLTEFLASVFVKSKIKQHFLFNSLLQNTTLNILLF